MIHKVLLVGYSNFQIFAIWTNSAVITNAAITREARLAPLTPLFLSKDPNVS
jgi:hypothetical protein